MRRWADARKTKSMCSEVGSGDGEGRVSQSRCARISGVNLVSHVALIARLTVGVRGWDGHAFHATASAQFIYKAPHSMKLGTAGTAISFAFATGRRDASPSESLLGSSTVCDAVRWYNDASPILPSSLVTHFSEDRPKTPSPTQTICVLPFFYSSFVGPFRSE